MVVREVREVCESTQGNNKGERGAKRNAKVISKVKLIVK